jgi:thermitase
VTFVSPAKGSTVSGSVTINVKFSDNSGSTSLRPRLLIDGKLVASGTGNSLSYTWNTAGLAAGSHEIRANAADPSGNASYAKLTVQKL